VSFPEAVRQLAQRAGLPVPERTRLRRHGFRSSSRPPWVGLRGGNFRSAVSAPSLPG
jgi:hypothetical protein